jgi:hypothetical protein
MSIYRAFQIFVLAGFLAAVGSAQEEKVEENYRAFGVAMGPGVSGVLNIHITRWSSEEERLTLVKSLIENGQEKTVDLLREQEETGWASTQTGAGMRGWPSVRIRYAHEFPQPDGKRVIVLVTDRTITMAEARRGGRSLDYEISALVMELEKGEDGKEEGQGVLYIAAELGFDEEKKQIEIEHLGTQPIRLTDIKREK